MSRWAMTMFAMTKAWDDGLITTPRHYRQERAGSVRQHTQT
jgi:hypothetical protein